MNSKELIAQGRAILDRDFLWAYSPEYGLLKYVPVTEDGPCRTYDSSVDHYWAAVSCPQPNDYDAFYIPGLVRRWFGL